MALALPNVAPLARRMRAWWNGFDTSAPPAHALTAPVEAGAPKPGLPPLDSNRKVALWTEPRIHLLERVWGTGFTAHGDAEWVAGLIAPLALDSKMTVVNLGAGLGGVTRATAAATGAWVTGYEANPAYVEAGMELSTMAGVAKRAPILRYDPAAPSLRAESCNAVIAFDAFHAIADKPALYAAIFDAVRLDGHLLFTDYMAAGAGGAKPATEEWLKLEPGPVHLTTAEEAQAALQAAEFDVRIVENITADVRRLITVGWARFADLLRQTNFDRRLGAALADELGLSLARLRVLESGEVGVRRVHAMKLRSKRKR